MLEIQETHREIRAGACDRCGQDLLRNQDGNANYGILKPCFGWPCQLDPLLIGPERELHLCAFCWVLALQWLDLHHLSEIVEEQVVAAWFEKRNLREHLKY